MKVNHSQIAEGLSNNAPDAIIVLDPDAVLWSNGASNIFGWSNDEAQGRFLYQLVIPATPISEAKTNFEAGLSTGTPSCESIAGFERISILRTLI